MTTEQQQQQTTTTTTTVVTFHNKIKVIEIPGLSYYTEEDYDAVWYTAEEYDQIAEHRRRCYQRGPSLQNDETLTKEEKQMSELGTATLEESNERKQRIHDARIAVFREQQLQWDEHILDDELLADVYYDCTIESQLLAYECATQLHQEELLEQQTQNKLIESMDSQPRKPKRRISSRTRSTSNSSGRSKKKSTTTVVSPKKKNKKSNNSSTKYSSVKQLGGSSNRSREVFVA